MSPDPPACSPGGAGALPVPWPRLVILIPRFVPALCTLWSVLGLGLALGGCSAPYFGNLAKDFGGTLTSPSSDLSPMLRGIGDVCRRNADLAYLRNRIEDPTDRHFVPFQERLTSTYSGRSQSISARCAEMDKQIPAYRLMQQTLLAYGAALRALGDTEGTDFHDTFNEMGFSLDQIALQVRPDLPELGLAMMEGATSINKLLSIALSARSESDIKKAIRAAAVPVRNLLERLDRARGVYADEVGAYVDASQAMMTEAERATRPLPRGALGRSFDVLTFYHMALHNEQELTQLRTSVQVYNAILKNLRTAHDRMVEAANSRVPAKDAFQSVRQSMWDLGIQLNYLYYDINSIRLKGSQ